MATTSCRTDDKARITLPGNFANCTVLIEEVSDTELRVRKARVIPLDELPLIEEATTRLSDRDRDIFLGLLDNPPPPTEGLRRLMRTEMKLSPKAIRFVIEALEHYENYQDQRLQREGLSEDEISDLINDRQYLEAIKQDLAKHHDTLLQLRENVEPDGKSQR